MISIKMQLAGNLLDTLKDSPDITSGSKDFYSITVDSLPSGTTSAFAYICLSWVPGTSYSKILSLNGSSGSCVLDEFYTTIPSVANDYVDYHVSVSVVGYIGDVRYTTSVVEIPVLKTNYSISSGTPEIPESQYDAFVKEVTGYTDSQIESKTVKKSDVTQILGVSTTKVPSEKAVSDAINANALRGKKRGGTVRIDDAAPIQHELTLQVKSKNLIPQPYDFTTKTVNGVTFTVNEDGTITANGTATANIYFVLQRFIPLQLNTTYTLSGAPAGSSSSTYCLYMINSGVADWAAGSIYNQLMKATFTPIKSPGQEGYGVSLVVYSGTVCDNVIFSPQIEEGATATAYTKGVTPAAVTVRRNGKNLIPYPYRYGTQTINGITFTVNEDRSITVNGTATATATFQISEDDALSDLIGQTVTLSGCPTGGSESTYRMRYQQTGVSSDVGNGATFTVKVKSYLAIQVFAGTVCDNVVFKPQIEVGNAATTYEPYIPPTEYTPAVDGVVSGVLTLYPVTTLTTDSAGAVLEAGYNRDLNKAFEELQQAIISLGGTV